MLAEMVMNTLVVRRPLVVNICDCNCNPKEDQHRESDPQNLPIVEISDALYSLVALHRTYEASGQQLEQLDSGHDERKVMHKRQTE